MSASYTEPSPNGDCKEKISIMGPLPPDTSLGLVLSNSQREGEHSPVAFKRDISGLNMIATAFDICNSWTAVATTIAIAIAAGGTFTLVYGIIIVATAYLAVAATLAELASVYPTSGGQYHFTSILAPKEWSRSLSYLCGVAASCSWVFLSAGVVTVASQVLMALPIYYSDDYQPPAWHYFLVYQALNILVAIYNMVGMKKTPWVNELGFVVSILTFSTVTISCLARSSKQPSAFVWDSFQNQTGWPAGVCFLTGLVTPGAMFLGLDGALHLADECMNPRKTIPKALMTTAFIGFTTGFVFAISMCYGITDMDALLATTMPIYELWRQALRSPEAATVFCVFLLMALMFTVNAIVQTSSRMTWAFAQDGGFFGSKRVSAVHPTLQVPLWALLANGVIVAILGCIYLGSAVAFNAIIGTSLIMQMISFAIPTVLLMVQKRDSRYLPEDRSFKLPNWLGWLANSVVAAFAVIEVIFFDFPPAIPVSGSTMNYAPAVLVVIAGLATVNWYTYAKVYYNGPRIGQDGI